MSTCASPASPPRLNSTAAQFERSSINAVLKTGFSEIRDKSLIERSTAELFIAGLRNISTLDPEYRFTAEHDRLLLTRDNAPVLTLDRPESDDLQGWVTATIAMYDAARRASSLAATANREILYQLMFDGALIQIDPYSRYSGNQSAGVNRANRNGFIGIGIDYDMRVDGAYILSVVPDGPAGHAGLREGDVISAVDGKDVTGLTREATRRLIAGPAGTSVRLAVVRADAGEKLTLAVKRGLIVPHTVDWTLTDNNVAVIHVHSFNIRTSTDVSEAVTKIKERTNNRVKGYVLDLRG
ncbi:MAG: PDZ domain-containing protein, partial [Rhodospirillaceae bacterium]|nr:PDZ domain-containing protein [Rhodospirillaceae bacterium]